MTVLLDTDQLAVGDRADAVHAAYEGQEPRRTVVLGPGPVRHRVARVALAPEMHLLRTEGNPLEIVRCGPQVRADAHEHLALGWHRSGAGQVSTGGADSQLPVGELNCVDMTRPYRLAHHTAHAHDVLILSNRQCGVTVDLVRAAAPLLRRSPVYELVRTHLAGLHRAVGGLAPEHLPLIAEATATLVRALLTTAAESRDRGEAMDAALETRISHYIDANLADRELTVERIAAVHSISVRHLYNVWGRAGHELTPAQWIIERRLQLARDQLANPLSERLSVAAIAKRCGFTDGSHFSRRFRQAYGMSPIEWRVVAQEAARR